LPIVSEKRTLFGAKVTILETNQYIATISTAKAGILKGLETIIIDGRFPSGRMCAKFTYPQGAKKSDRLQFHDLIVSGIEEAASNGGTLYQSIEAIAGYMEEQGLVDNVMNVC